MDSTHLPYQISLPSNDSEGRTIYEFTTTEGFEYNIYLFPYLISGHGFFDGYPELETDKTVQFDFYKKPNRFTRKDIRVSSTFCKFIFDLFTNEPDLVLFFTTSEDFEDYSGYKRRTAAGRGKLFGLWYREYSNNPNYDSVKLTFQISNFTNSNGGNIVFGYITNENNPNLKLLEDWTYNMERVSPLK